MQSVSVWTVDVGHSPPVYEKGGGGGGGGGRKNGLDLRQIRIPELFPCKLCTPQVTSQELLIPADLLLKF